MAAKEHSDGALVVIPEQKSMALVHPQYADAIAKTIPRVIKTRELLIADNGGEVPTIWEQARIRIPGSGGRQFIVTSGDAATDEHVDEIVGVVLGVQTKRAFWALKFGSGQTSPPDCSSEDGVRGTGEPGGRCNGCVYNKFPARGEGAGGKPCKEQKILWILRPGLSYPTPMLLPVMSAAKYKNYSMDVISGRFGVADDGVRGVLTRIRLTQEKNSGGIAYARASFEVAGALSPETIDALAALADQIREQAIDLDRRDFESD